MLFHLLTLLGSSALGIGSSGEARNLGKQHPQRWIPKFDNLVAFGDRYEVAAILRIKKLRVP
jgi:hypothetical protein